nr:stage II sporulation protein M [Salinirubrum litoreum]
MSSALGVPRLAALIALLAVPPVVDGFKTALYAGRSLPPVGGRSLGATGVRADDGRESDDSEADETRVEATEEHEPSRPETDDGFVWGPTTDDADPSTDDGEHATDAEPPTDDAESVEADTTSQTAESAGTDEPLPDAEAFADPGTHSRPGVGSRFVGGFRRGLTELGRFLVEHPLANLAGVLLFALGIGAGWQLTAGVGTRLGGPANVATVFGETPLEATAVFGNIAANNWLVAATASFGGLGFGVPTAVSLLFNGVLIGALGGVFDRLTFLALVAPHGVIEIPALAVSGGLGLHLGRVGYRGLRGRVSVDAVADELRRGFDVLVGLAVVFVVAAGIEAYLTPALAAWILG